jgi:hypothetical protein
MDAFCDASDKRNVLRARNRVASSMKHAFLLGDYQPVWSVARKNEVFLYVNHYELRIILGFALLIQFAIIPYQEQSASNCRASFY